MVALNGFVCAIAEIGRLALPIILKMAIQKAVDAFTGTGQGNVQQNTGTGEKNYIGYGRQ